MKKRKLVGQAGADPAVPLGNGFRDRHVCRFVVLTHLPVLSHTLQLSQ